MSKLHIVLINSRMYMTADLNEFNQRLAQAKRKKHHIAEKFEYDLDKIEVVQLERLQAFIAQKDVVCTKSAVEAIKAESARREEDKFD